VSGDDFFAAPTFKADEALQKLQRELRALGLSERAGTFERRGIAIARVALDGDALQVGIVKRPSRSSPEWAHKALKSAADSRDFVADVKKRLALWSDRDD
jgi:hypothetical protein